MRSDTLSIRDRLLAVLREADDYMTSTEVGKAAGDHFLALAHSDKFHNDARFAFCLTDGRVRSCYIQAGLETVNNRAHRELVAMEKKGLVVRATQQAPDYRVYWLYVKPDTPDPGPMLEAIWRAPARDHA